jgi:hypothetical protein
MSRALHGKAQRSAVEPLFEWPVPRVIWRRTGAALRVLQRGRELGCPSSFLGQSWAAGEAVVVD